MPRFLLFPAVLAVVAYATLGGADFSDIIKFGFVLLIAWAARKKRRSDSARWDLKARAPYDWFARQNNANPFQRFSCNMPQKAQRPFHKRARPASSRPTNLRQSARRPVTALAT